MNSAETKTITWNAVPGAGSYLVEDLIEGLGDPSLPDWTFGGAYTESHNGESPNLKSYPIGHTVLYRMTFRLRVTALNRTNPSFTPCSAEVRYVVEPDLELASIAARKIIPLAGKDQGMNNSSYSTALILSGTRFESTAKNDAEKFYRGRIYFRPLGTSASAADPSIPYFVDGAETVVFDDIMAALGTTGLGTIEVIPTTGPAPQVDAILENTLPDGKRVGARVGAVWGRDQLRTVDSITVGFRNSTDTRLAIGVRSYSELGGALIFQHLTSSGKVLETVQSSARGNATELHSLSSLFPSPLQAGDRITARYMGMSTAFPGTIGIGTGAVVLFVTETGNDLNNPNIVYRDSVLSPRHSDGFDPFLVR